MKYIVVCNGCDYAALEAHRPIPRNWWLSGEGKTFATKKEAQEWVSDEVELLGSLPERDKR